MKYVPNIWCMRTEHTFFKVSRILDHGVSWYVVLFGKEYWIGPNRPEFLNKRNR